MFGRELEGGRPVGELEGGRRGAAAGGTRVRLVQRGLGLMCPSIMDDITGQIVKGWQPQRPARSKRMNGVVAYDDVQSYVQLLSDTTVVRHCSC